MIVVGFLPMEAIVPITGDIRPEEFEIQAKLEKCPN